jgi:hypothetical protein
MMMPTHDQGIDQKLCPVCHLTYPLTPAFFYRNKRKKDGYYRQCKQCWSRYSLAWRQGPKRRATPYEVPAEKRCPRCHLVKPLTPAFFYRNKSQKIGFNAACKSCLDKENRDQYWRDPNQYRQAQQRYRLANLERYLARQRAYSTRLRSTPDGREALHQRERKRYLADVEASRRRGLEAYWRHPETSREQTKRWKRAHPERVRATTDAWRKAHPVLFREMDRVRQQRRRARKQQLPAAFTHAEKRACLAYWQHACAICGAQEGFFHTLVLDHWIPLRDTANCPGTVAENLVPLCHGKYGCNNIKSARDPEAFLVSRFGTRFARRKLAEVEAYFASIRSKKAASTVDGEKKRPS